MMEVQLPGVAVRGVDDGEADVRGAMCHGDYNDDDRGGEAPSYSRRM